MIFQCEGCGKQWRYAVRKCIFCKGDVVNTASGKATVRGSTRIDIPSPGHSRVPYYDLLLEDEHGNFHIRKYFDEHEIGAAFAGQLDEPARQAPERLVGVVGAGTMGGGIAQVCAQTGYQVILSDISEEIVGKAMGKIDKRLAKVCKEDEKQEILGRIRTTTSLADMAEAELVEEASIEDLDVKLELLRELDRVCSKDAIFATNTSSLSLAELSQVLDDPGRLVGLHFFNPVPKMKLVEIIKLDSTPEKTLQFAKDVALEMGKTPVVTGDAPGFIVNRLLLLFLNEAIDKLADGTSTAEDIDTAVELGLNHPMGPLALADLIGLDVCEAILDILYKGYGDPKYKPCPTLREMVKKGELGRKTGKGFYAY